MLITCPACASDYEIDAARIGPAGRKVRCAACRESWFLTAPAEAAPEAPEPGRAVEADVSPPEPPADEPAAASPVVIEADPAPRRGRPKAPVRKDRRRSGMAAAPRRRGRALAAVALAGACAVLAAIPLRSSVVAALPGTASLYGAIGLPVNLVGLSLDSVASSLVQESGVPVLVVTGRVRNVGGSDRAVPPLQLAIEGEAGQALYSWSARAGEAELASGAETGFRVRLASPPPAGRRVQVTFRDGRDRLGVAMH